MASQGNPPQEPAEPAPNIHEKIQTLCSDYQNGICKHGKDCKFTHDPDTVYLPKPTTETSKLLTQLRNSLMGCRLDNPSLSERSEATLSICENVLKILDSPYRGLHQEVARTLATQRCGLQNMITTVKNSLKKEGTKNPCVTAFIKVISHSSFLNCSAIESDVNTIYSIFGGKDGHDGMGFMFFLCRTRLASLECFNGPLSSEVYEKELCAARVCHELVRRAPRSHFRTTKPMFLDTLDSLVARMCDKFPRDNLDALVRRLDIIKRLAASPRTHLARADTPRALEQDSQDHLTSIPTTIDRPGGRHDNDFADIANVVIFPTTEEVIRVYEDYLPSTNFRNQHVLGDTFQRYIDSLFRLIRYDTMGPIVKVLREICKSDNLMAGRLYQQDIRADTYLSCSVHDIFMNHKQELRVLLSFPLPPEISNRSFKHQKKWWKYSVSLEEGRLVCFVYKEADHANTLFFQVAAKDPKQLDVSGRKPRVIAKLLSLERSIIKQLAHLVEKKTPGVLVDFHSVLPDTFMPMFDNLQRIRLENQLPFYKWLTPSEPATDEVPPPLYARREGFAFPLSSIAKDKNTTLQLYSAQGLHGINLFDLKNKTGLDSGQCQGLIAALTREYALIQGPPGTGKSYLGVKLVQVLLAVRKQANLGPIVISCYTNHALDQFLKHLNDIGINNIVRIGNRSTTPELESKNLRAIKVKLSLSPVPNQPLRKTFVVPILAPKSFLAGTPVLEYAETVFVVPELPVTHGARPLAIVRVTLAIIDVQSFAMVRVHVMTANKLARFDARTPVAPPPVPKPAMNATSNVLGLVLTKAHARCLVQHHATAFLAIEDAKESWTAVIDVQASAERNALLKVDLDENPIVLLGCGHFFTGRSLDSLLGMGEVYLMNNHGQFLGLKDFSGSFSKNVPCCPDCLKRSAKRVEERAEKHIQQTKPLIDAIAMTQTQAIDEPSHVEALTSYQLTPGQQISLKAQLLVIRVAEVHVYSHFSESCLMPWTSTEVNAFQRWLKVQALPTLPELLCDCTSLIERAKHANMPRLVIIGTLSFARILRLWRLCNDVESKPDSGEDLSHAAIADKLLKSARKLLDVALSLCSQLSKSEEWKEGVQETMRALKSPHKVITNKELVYNKNTRIGGHAGMVTTSALWYNCVNGHPFAVGDCAMSTEVARCRECGAPVGGTNPQPLDGVTRAEEMETE
ncbi:NFX1-type zinc finger-containing protein 1 [Fusarium oxysporum f. sp. cubense race 1]|uniref:NFX1-type zinc finger-containing protein 1 n=1 Tax=Fusarium oxysporum f. sp. cubense (strain race 1) TaxID=1229664 RepID=N4U228_FUSC1|nr:NFX1-type zinc finger-containing protein 1 [Fusarium oxysporum f. sp. cubense race 1]